MAPLDDLFHLLFLSFENSFHTSVPGVPDPAFHSKIEGCFLGMLPEEDPLNPSFNDKMRSNFFHYDLTIITGFV